MVFRERKKNKKNKNKNKNENKKGAIFIEVPAMTMNKNERQRKYFNRYFKKIWEQYLRRDLRGPPENTKDIIITVGLMMEENGDWQNADALIQSLRFWNDLKQSQYVYQKVRHQLKLECLRCYLAKYGSVYQSIRIQELSNMFGLTFNECQQFLCKMIVSMHSNYNSMHDSLFKASIDSLTQCLIIHTEPPTPMQRIATDYCDKLNIFIENNEKLMGIKINQPYNIQQNRFAKLGFYFFFNFFLFFFCLLVLCCGCAVICM